jgi:Tfp pilus assembly protein PilZ
MVTIMFDINSLIVFTVLYSSFSAFCEALNISNRTNKEFEIGPLVFWIHPVSSLDYGPAEVYLYLLGKPFAYILYT